MTSTTVDLLTALGTHLSAFELPDIASVHLSVSLSGPPVTVQLSCGAPPVIAAGCWPGPTPSPTSPPKPGASPEATPYTSP
jgi:hypothetical protein